jgi:predicted SAM-dependent methyltransferase
VLFKVHTVRLLHHWFGSQIREPRSARLLRRQIESHDRLRLAVGSESHCRDGWIPTGRDQLDLANPTSWSRFFQKSSVDAILAEHVWEHLSEPDGKIAARNCFQFLRPGGYLRVAVADEFHPAQQSQSHRRSRGTESTPSAHCVFYNHQSLAEAFSAVGFNVRLIEYFDRDGAFHSKHWDVSKGLVQRTLLFDERNLNQPYAYTSLVLDAIKPDAAVMGIEPELAGNHEPKMIGWEKVNAEEHRSSNRQEFLEEAA